MSRPLDLAGVLAPVDPETFFRERWERAPLVVRRGDPGFYGGLLSLADVDRIVTGHGLAYPSLRLVRDGKPLPLRSYTGTIPWGGDAFRRAVLPDRVLQAYREGATIVLQALHRNWPPLAELCRALEERLTHRVQTNVYLTPKGSRGFAAHFDRHDVFVLQLHGSKRWRIWEAAMELPTRQRYDSKVDTPGALLEELDLAAGDLIYLPRGFVHEAESTTESSLHVTLGVVCYTWADVVTRVLDACHDDPRFRRSLPAGALGRPEAAAALDGELRELLSGLAERASLAPILAELAERFASSRTPVLEGQLLLVDAPPEVTPETVLARRPGVLSTLTSEDGRVALSFHGKRVDLPAELRPAVEHVRGAAVPFRVGELPGALDEPGKVDLARRLLLEGYLVPVER